MAEAGFTAIANGRDLVADLTDARKQWQKVHARRDAVVLKVADLLLKQPVVDSALVQSAMDATSAKRRPRPPTTRGRRCDQGVQ
jgi:hypothetical protein